ILVCRYKNNLLQALGFELFAQCQQVGPIAAGLADMDLLSREVVQALQWRGARAGDEHFLYLRQPRIGEGDDLQALRRDGQVTGGDIAETLVEPRQQAVAGNGDEGHPDLQRLGLVFLVDADLELTPELRRRPTLRSLVQEIDGLAEGNQDADQS